MIPFFFQIVGLFEGVSPSQELGGFFFNPKRAKTSSVLELRICSFLRLMKIRKPFSTILLPFSSTYGSTLHELVTTLHIPSALRNMQSNFF